MQLHLSVGCCRSQLRQRPSSGRNSDRGLLLWRVNRCRKFRLRAGRRHNRRCVRLLSLSVILAAIPTLACDGRSEAWSMSKSRVAPRQLQLGERVPDQAENEVVGGVQLRLVRGDPRWQRLAPCRAPGLVFKDEERNGSDRYMTPRLCELLGRLARAVEKEWPGLSLRVTEAWDGQGEHGRASLHYEGRAADLTTSDSEPTRLGRLGRLAVDAGLDWVYFENRSHVHVSVRR